MTLIYIISLHIPVKKIQIETDEQILIEYVSANPTGPLHIGHGRWAVIGDCLFRLFKAVGINIENEFYVNDAGNQINLFDQSVNATKEIIHHFPKTATVDILYQN